MNYDKAKLKESIKKMQEVYDAESTSDSTKDAIRPSLEKAKKLLEELESKKEEPEEKPAPAEIRKVVSKGNKKIAKVKPAKKSAKAIQKKLKTEKRHTAKKQKPAKLTTQQKKTLREIVAATKKYAGYRGKSERQLQLDSQHKAKKPGSRVSASGKTYREYRLNRADVDKHDPYLKRGGKIIAKGGTPLKPITEAPKKIQYTIHHKARGGKINDDQEDIKFGYKPEWKVKTKEGYLSDIGGYEFYYTRGEAIKKAKVFDGKIEHHVPKVGVYADVDPERRPFAYFESIEKANAFVGRSISNDFLISITPYEPKHYYEYGGTIAKGGTVVEGRGPKPVFLKAKGGSVTEAELVKFESMYDGLVDAYKSTTIKDLYYYLSDVGHSSFSVVVEKKGKAATEARDDWIHGRDNAMRIAKDLAEGKRDISLADGGEIEDEGYDEIESGDIDNEPDHENDAFIEDETRGGYNVSFAGKFLGNAEQMDEAL